MSKWGLLGLQNELQRTQKHVLPPGVRHSSPRYALLDTENSGHPRLNYPSVACKELPTFFSPGTFLLAQTSLSHHHREMQPSSLLKTRKQGSPSKCIIYIDFKPVLREQRGPFPSAFHFPATFPGSASSAIKINKSRG